MRMLRLAFLVMAATAAACATAQAQQCGPLKRALSLDLTPGPAGGPLMGVAVTVNGTPRNLLLNTAGQISRLSRAVVTELKLAPRSQGKMLGLDGTVTNAFVVMADLGISGQTLKGNEMLVDENIGRFDGQYAPDLMQRFDIELDFAGRKMNYFVSDHCDGQVVYWPNTGITTVDFRGWTEHGSYPYMTIPVSIDGHEVLATVNTGTAQTTLEADTAHQLFDLTADSAGAIPMGTLDGDPAHRVYGYTFKTLKIGGLTLNAPRMSVIPDLLGKKGNDTVRADSRIIRYTDHKLPTVRLGMDVLRRMHLYVAIKEQKLYITQAAVQPAARPQGAAPAPLADSTSAAAAGN